MKNNTAELLALIAQHNLSTKQIAKLLNREPQTVRHWRSKTGFRVIPDSQLELLKLKLASRQQGDQPCA